MRRRRAAEADRERSARGRARAADVKGEGRVRPPKVEPHHLVRVDPDRRIQGEALDAARPIDLEGGAEIDAVERIEDDPRGEVDAAADGVAGAECGAVRAQPRPRVVVQHAVVAVVPNRLLVPPGLLASQREEFGREADRDARLAPRRAAAVALAAGRVDDGRLEVEDVAQPDERLKRRARRAALGGARRCGGVAELLLLLPPPPPRRRRSAAANARHVAAGSMAAVRHRRCWRRRRAHKRALWRRGDRLIGVRPGTVSPRCPWNLASRPSRTDSRRSCGGRPRAAVCMRVTSTATCNRPARLMPRARCATPATVFLPHEFVIIRGGSEAVARGGQGGERRERHQRAYA